MQAIVKIGSSQYIVDPGQELLVDRGQIDAVLYPEGAKVTIKDLGEVKGKKIRSAKYKAKSRYRKVRGFKPVYHKIKIEKITALTVVKKQYRITPWPTQKLEVLPDKKEIAEVNV